MRSSSIAATALFVVAIAGDASPRANIRCSGEVRSGFDELRRMAEGAPLYRALARSAPLVACHAEQADGRMTLAFYFRDSGSVLIERDAGLEHTSQEARAGTMFRAEPMTVLRDAEQAAFGYGGCGIDWRKPSIQRTPERPHARVTVYRGDVCNCRARIARDEQGRLEGLALGSAC